MPRTPKKGPKKGPGQWGRDCPDDQRELVPGLNKALKDMLNPCELARKLGVKLQDLQSSPVPDPTTRPYR
jgi:hypothetical protein